MPTHQKNSSNFLWQFLKYSKHFRHYFLFLESFDAISNHDQWDKMEKNGHTQNHGTAWYQGTSLQQHQRVCRICQSDFWGHLQLWNNRGRPKTIYESSRAHLVPSQSFSRFFFEKVFISKFQKRFVANHWFCRCRRKHWDGKPINACSVVLLSTLSLDLNLIFCMNQVGK